jgi:sugar phosphate permease
LNSFISARLIAMPVEDSHKGQRTEPPTSTRLIVLAGLCAAASSAYLCRNSIGVAESTIREDLGLSMDAMGSVMGSFFLVYALGQIPMGWLGGQLGSRRAIPICAVAWSIATAMMSFAVGTPLLLVSRVTSGLAQAGLFPSCVSTIGIWSPDTRRGVASGALVVRQA